MRHKITSPYDEIHFVCQTSSSDWIRNEAYKIENETVVKSRPVLIKGHNSSIGAQMLKASIFPTNLIIGFDWDSRGECSILTRGNGRNQQFYL